MRTTFASWRGRLLAMTLSLLALCLLPAPAARAAGSIESYALTGAINADGTLALTETITFGGGAPATFVQRFATVMRADDDLEYHYRITDLKATSGGQALPVQTAQDGAFLVVTVPTQGLSAPVELTYVVTGASRLEQTGETTISWRGLQGIAEPVSQFTAELTTPGMIKLVDCEAGPAATPGACTFYGGGTHEHPTPFFSDGPRGADEIVALTVRFPQGVVAANADVRQLWTLRRAFALNPLTLGVSLAVLALGGLVLWLLHRRVGTDAGAAGEPRRVAEFHPVGEGALQFRVLDGVRPGHVGTVVDERVDPIDITATVLDLAVRGHLRIEELPREDAFAGTEWTFARRPGGDDLAEFERVLLDAVAPVQGEPVRVANLAAAVGTVIGDVQAALYDDVVARGWFAHRPDRTRGAWALIGWLTLGVAALSLVLLAAFTGLGLIGLALLLVGLGTLWVSQEMPARTAKGVALVNGLGLLRAELHGQRTELVSAGAHYEGLSAVLPYAVVLGGADRWTAAIVAADGDAEADPEALPWYHAPGDWHLANLPHSLRNFLTTVQGTLFSR